MVLVAGLVLLVANPSWGAQQTGSTDESGSPAALTIEPQAPKPADMPVTPAHTGLKAMFKDLGQDVKHLPSMENLYWAAGGGAMALAVHQADEYVNEHISGNRLASDIFKPGAIIGNVVPWAGSIATYAYGRIKDQKKVSHVGMDLIQAQIIAYGITQGLKYATQRERPDGSSNTSFPSGHASSTFAFATALERHLGWRYAVPAYALASYVAASRLPAQRHWLSDVVFGAAVGIISGRTATSKEDAHPYPVSVHALQGGAVVMFTPARFNR